MSVAAAGRIGTIGVVLAFLGGCATLPAGFQEPDIQLRQVVVRGVGLEGGNLDLIVQVYNPNNFSLRGTRIDAGFDVQGSHVGDITYRSDFQVQQGDTAMITLPVTFQWSGVGGALRSALSYGDLPYKLTGRATLQLPGGREVGVPFQREGRVPLTRAVGVPLQAVPPS